MTDFAAARRHMVDGQVRPADVTDLRIISAMLEVPRECYLPPQALGLAYLDLAVDVGTAGPGLRRLLTPMVLAKLLQAAEISAGDRVLNVGCATGYTAAVMASLAGLAGQVVALEQDAKLAQAAQAALAPLPNVNVVQGPLIDGWPQGAPYDAILIEGGVEVIPATFCRQLKEGGRLLCVLGASPGAAAMLYRRSGGELGGRAIFDAAATMLPGFAKTVEFAF